jgi:hypothetical protein
MYTLILKESLIDSEPFVVIKTNENLTSLLAVCSSLQRLAAFGFYYDVVNYLGESMTKKKGKNLMDEIEQELEEELFG